MKKEEYLILIKSIDEEIEALYEKKRLARESFLKENAGFKTGDKVAITFPSYFRAFTKEIIPETRLECYVGEVSDKYYKGDIDYNFKKSKKDGTPSLNSQYVSLFSKYSIELIKAAEE